MRVTFESLSKMLHVQRNINILHVSSVFRKTFALIYQAIHVGGWASKTQGSPTGKSSSEFDVFAPAPAPHARHDRSMARNRLVARPFSGFCPTSSSSSSSSSPPPSVSRVPRPWACFSAAFCHTSNGILTIPRGHGEDMESLC